MDNEHNDLIKKVIKVRQKSNNMYVVYEYYMHVCAVCACMYGNIITSGDLIIIITQLLV